MTYTEISPPGTGSRIFGTLHTNMESTYPTHPPNLTYIEKDTSFLFNNYLTSSSRLDNWRRLTDDDYTSKFTPSPTSPMGMAPSLKKVTIMSTKMNSVKPPTNVLTKDTQGQNNGKGVVRP